MSKDPAPSDFTGSAHEWVYRSIRLKIMTGEVAPGTALTLRGIGAEFGVSMTPAREAARRLVAEGALTLSNSGRISTPVLSRDRIEELASVRALLEPELAARALPRAHPALIERLHTINEDVKQSIAKRDACGYIRGNLEFHRSLYLRAQAPAMLAMTETVWLQLGPTMCELYKQMGPRDQSGLHLKILATLRAADEGALRVAVRHDVTLGLKMLI